MVDLRTCKPGDKLRSKHGVILTYVDYWPDDHFPHEVAYPDGSWGSRTDDGFVFHKNRLPEDHDIVEIIKV